MAQLISDEETYLIVENNPTNHINDICKTILGKLVEKTHLSKCTSVTFKNLHPYYPGLNGLPKIHKIDVSLRPIVYNINSPFYFFFKYIGELSSLSSSSRLIF